MDQAAAQAAKPSGSPPSTGFSTTGVTGGSSVNITGGWVPGSGIPGVGASVQPIMAGTMGPSGPGMVSESTGLADPALDDPDHVSDEPEIPAEALAGRRTESTPSAEHVGLGDDA
jgi:hypothetical protein